MDDVTKLIRTELSVGGCHVVLTRVNAKVVFFHLGMPMVFMEVLSQDMLITWREPLHPGMIY